MLKFLDTPYIDTVRVVYKNRHVGTIEPLEGGVAFFSHSKLFDEIGRYCDDTPILAMRYIEGFVRGKGMSSPKPFDHCYDPGADSVSIFLNGELVCKVMRRFGGDNWIIGSSYSIVFKPLLSMRWKTKEEAVAFIEGYTYEQAGKSWRHDCDEPNQGASGEGSDVW